MPYERVLITGGSGFIGSNLVRWLLNHRPGRHVVNLDKLTYSGNPENLADLEQRGEMEHAERYTFVHGDINDRALVARCLDEHAIDAVLHLAAESHVDRSIMDARPFIESNVAGTQCLLDAVREQNEKASGRSKPIRLLHVSTDEVYGSLPLDRPDMLFTEDMPLMPSSPYSASKASADLLLHAAHHTFGMDVVTTRCSNNFGPYQFPEKVIPLFVTNLMEGKKVPLYGDGLNVRDWLHVEDHCEAIVTVLEKAAAASVYNIGGNNERSNLELTHTLLEIMNFGGGKGKDMIEHVADRPGHDRRYAIDASRIRNELGWEPTRSAWPDALEATVKWYVDNKTWWERVKSGAYRDYYAKQYGLS